MNQTAINVTNLSKQYAIGALKQRHNTLRDEIVHSVRSLMTRKGDAGKNAAGRDSIWAVKDMSFEVERGEVLGIVGRNGAGKSTLLKILSRITEPTQGRCEIYGRLASLLEVGTGFHGELTGRENIYFNGAVLGMTKEEITRKFDEIVAFAEVGQFIDTPVKRYSSGMHVRLGFAVAAHLEPEILIVDEVLAVGDLSFQTKCLGKLGDVSREGRTVLFVSHNMGAVTNLCRTAMWVDRGGIRMRGDARSVVDAYVRSQRERADAAADAWTRVGSGEGRIVSVRLLDARGDECDAFLMGDAVTVEFDVEFNRPLANVNMTLYIVRSDMGMRVLEIQNDDAGFSVHGVTPGRRRFRIVLPNCMLYPTDYDIQMALWSHEQTIDYVDRIGSFTMIQSDVTRRTSSLTLNSQAIYFAPTVWSEVQSA